MLNHCNGWLNVVRGKPRNNAPERIGNVRFSSLIWKPQRLPSAAINRALVEAGASSRSAAGRDCSTPRTQAGRRLVICGSRESLRQPLRETAGPQRLTPEMYSHLPRIFSNSRTKIRTINGIAAIAKAAKANPVPIDFKEALSLINPHTKKIAAITKQPPLPTIIKCTGCFIVGSRSKCRLLHRHLRVSLRHHHHKLELGSSLLPFE